MPDSITVGELLVRIRADVSQLERGLTAAQNGVNGLATRSRPGFQRLENAFLMVGVRAAGVSGPIGSLTRTLLTFAPGGLVTAGVIAGLGAIALAWNKIRENARKAGEEMKAVMERAFKLSDFDQLVHDIELVTINMDEIRTKMERLTTARDALLARGVVEEAERFNQKLIDQTFLLQRVRAAYTLLTQQIQEFIGAQAAATPIDRADWGAAFRGPSRPAVRIGDIVGASKVALDSIGRDIGSIIANDQNIQRIVAAFEKQKEKFALIGQSIGEALAQGIYSILGGGNFFKGLFSTLLNIGIGVATGAIGNTITRGLTKGAGGISASKLAGAGISAALDFSAFPTATNPLAAARDKDWQRFFRESGLVAASQGFRG